MITPSRIEILPPERSAANADRPVVEALRRIYGTDASIDGRGKAGPGDTGQAEHPSFDDRLAESAVRRDRHENGDARAARGGGFGALVVTAGGTVRRDEFTATPFLVQHLAQEVMPRGLAMDPVVAANRAYRLAGLPSATPALRLVA